MKKQKEIKQLMGPDVDDLLTWPVFNGVPKGIVINFDNKEYAYEFFIPLKTLKKFIERIENDSL